MQHTKLRAVPKALIKLILEYRNKLQHETGRYNAGEVHSPGGLLRQMIKLYNTGDLRLDRTLRGLAARYVSGEAQATAKPAPIGPVLPFGASSLPSGFARGGSGIRG